MLQYGVIRTLALTKSKIYKTAIRPIMTYTAETRPKTAKTKRLLETTEMKVLRGIAEKTLLDRETSENIRRTCGYLRGKSNGTNILVEWRK